MKRIVAAAVAVAALGAMLQMTPAFSHGGGTEALEFFSESKPKGDTHVNVGKKGFSPGDYDVFQDRVLDPETGEKLGTVGGIVTVIRFLGPEDLLLQGEFTYDLAGGKIQVNGIAKASEIFSEEGAWLPVTGGTGEYAGVSGWANYVAGDMGSKEGTYDTLTLLMP